ncbi:hypothetical protein COHCIP112018_05576 [Cohnella sp. JJ-181]|nr:hypothetical protein COHCIP112018_05576 [Cohnella sp. JJ-181]
MQHGAVQAFHIMELVPFRSDLDAVVTIDQGDVLHRRAVARQLLHGPRVDRRIGERLLGIPHRQVGDAAHGLQLDEALAIPLPPSAVRGQDGSPDQAVRIVRADPVAAQRHAGRHVQMPIDPIGARRREYDAAPVAAGRIQRSLERGGIVARAVGLRAEVEHAEVRDHDVVGRELRIVYPGLRIRRRARDLLDRYARHGQIRVVLRIAAAADADAEVRAVGPVGELRVDQLERLRLPLPAVAVGEQRRVLERGRERVVLQHEAAAALVQILDGHIDVLVPIIEQISVVHVHVQVQRPVARCGPVRFPIALAVQLALHKTGLIVAAPAGDTVLDRRLAERDARLVGC